MRISARFEILSNGRIFILSSCMGNVFSSVAPDSLIKMVSADAPDHELGLAGQQCIDAFRLLTEEEEGVFFGEDALFKAIRKEHELKMSRLAGFRSVSGMYKGMKLCVICLEREAQTIVVSPTRRRSPGRFQYLLSDYGVVRNAGMTVDELGYAIRDGIERSC